MIFRAILIWLAVPLAALLLSLEAYAASEGEPAPSFDAKLFDGSQFDLAQTKNKVVLLHFWATWCEACRAEMASLDKFNKEHSKNDFVLIAVNMDEEKRREEAIEMMKPLSFSSAFAKDAHFKKYGRIWRLPLTFVIDRKGILRKDGWVQSESLTEKNLKEELEPLLK